jgi:CobQ-like glutamine amidotransferase family enzyme
MTERVGRHASHDPGETLVLQAISDDDEPPYVPPSTGRHASGRSEDAELAAGAQQEDLQTGAAAQPQSGKRDSGPAALPAELAAAAPMSPPPAVAEQLVAPPAELPQSSIVTDLPTELEPAAEFVAPLPELPEPVAELAAPLPELPEPVAELAALPPEPPARSAWPDPLAAAEPAAWPDPVAMPAASAWPEPAALPEPVAVPEPPAMPEPAAVLEPAALHEPGEVGHGSPNGQPPANGQLPPYADPEDQIPAASLASYGRSGGSRPLRLVWVYPDLLSTYGDRGNLLVLIRRARLRGLEVLPIEVKSDEPVPDDGDIYLLGGGEDLPQILAAARLRADGGLQRAAERGAVVFAVCAGYQLIGRQFGGVEGEPVAGLGILDVTSGRGDRRGVGEIVADVDPALGVPRLTGFENHQGVTQIGPGARPLARLALGVGNGDGTEGAHAGKVLGTYLHGPALARNPGLADLLLSWAAGPMSALDPAAEDWARRLREERLAATSS